MTSYSMQGKWARPHQEQRRVLEEHAWGLHYALRLDRDTPDGEGSPGGLDSKVGAQYGEELRALAFCWGVSVLHLEPACSQIFYQTQNFTGFL